MTAAGVPTWLLGHTEVATFELGAVLAASEFAAEVVGAAYLGMRLMVSGAAHLRVQGSPRVSSKALFLEGAPSNLSNPKVTHFYLAFVPQFVSASAQASAISIFVLGVLFAILTIVIKGPIGFSAAHCRDDIRDHDPAAAPQDSRDFWEYGRLPARPNAAR